MSLAAVGVGFQFIDDGTWSVAGRAGIGGSQTFGGNRETFAPEGILGLDAARQIPGRAGLGLLTQGPAMTQWRTATTPSGGARKASANASALTGRPK